MQTPYRGRSVITESFNDVVITIPAKKNWAVLVLIGIWFFGCVAVQFVFPGGLFGPSVKDSPPDPFMMVWTIVFVAVAFLAGTVVWWNFAGKELVTFSQGVLTICKKGSITKTKSYNLKEAKNFRTYEEPIGDFGFGFNGNRQQLPIPWNIANNGTIRFDYGLATVKFGDRLYQAEAEYLLERLRDKKLIG